MFKKIVYKAHSCFVDFKRKLYCKKKRKQLKNTNFSIISSDCFGSFVYHTLGQKFNSPTINLFFLKDDFFEFLLHLKEYLEVELVELQDDSVNYPVGTLTYNNKTIRLNFMHYPSFDIAKSKWNERKSRINYSNLYIIQVVANGLTQEYADRFSSLPYKHKLLVTHDSDIICDCMVTHKVFSEKNYPPGGILRYKSPHSSSRHMDDIDYISFLNNKN